VWIILLEIIKSINTSLNSISLNKLLKRNSLKYIIMVEKEFKPEQVIDSIQGGINKLKANKVADTDALASIQYGQDTGAIVATIGAAPKMEFKDGKPGQSYSDKVAYTARMQIMEASFESNDKKACLKSAGFTSKVTKDATFLITYELVSYCQMAKLDTKEKCFILEKGDKMEFILPSFLECKDTDKKKLADCYCKSINNDNKPDVWIMGGEDGSSSTSPNTNSISSTGGSSSNTSGSTSSKSPNSSTSNSIPTMSQPWNLLPTLLMFYLLFMFLTHRN
ncbi:hypothetical protein K502DRAFT_56199, partial [Neoconidiobolus thromboides FSU 785]